MKRLLLVGVLAMASCNAPASGFEGASLSKVAPHLQVELAGATEGLALLNPRVEGTQLALDLTALKPVPATYGLAMRVEVKGARFVRAESSQAWALSRFEATAKGAVGVWSALGATMALVTLEGRIGTLWLELDGQTPGSARFDGLRTAVLDAQGQTVPMSWAGVSWAWK